MDRSLLEVLADPVSRTPLILEGQQNGTASEILDGALRGADGRRYPIVNSIPRFVLTEDEGQRQTETSFGFKWQQRDTYDSPEMRALCQPWLVERYGFADIERLRRYLAGRRRILDAGCGSGFTASLWMTPDWQGAERAEWIGADISAAIDVAAERMADLPGTQFVQADILQLPFRPESFDLIYSEGVLHHTPSTERALKALVELLTVDGELWFYVYRKKAPIREFTDDYVREQIAHLSPEAAWEALRPLTRLGQALAELKTEVEVVEDVPLLGIKAGRYDVQRLLYWHVAKLYWNEALSFEENNHVNFDWYHPRYAHRQTEEEIRRWCGEAGLKIERFNTQESGFTVRARRT